MAHRKANYDKEPTTRIAVPGRSAWRGYPALVQEVKQGLENLGQAKTVLVVECYPGVRMDEILTGLIKPLLPALTLLAEDAAMDGPAITEKMSPFLTEDRVFGFLYPFHLKDFYLPEKVQAFQRVIEEVQEGLVVVLGFGASLIHPGDLLVYADLARWEIQRRFRSGEMGNWKAQNEAEDTLRKYKRGFFLEWRMADRIKKKLLSRAQYWLDTNERDDPKLVTGEALRYGLREMARRPFRLVPYFDPGVWGGQWMKEVCDLDRAASNYAWSFDGVPEENSLYLQYDEVRLEIPAMDLVLYQPAALLGEAVYGRFGAEFPIRFDFLDTMGGQNLSLQVHPLTEYIQEAFGMHYTQDESYYMLDVGEDAGVFLGVKEGVDPQAALEDLRRAQRGEIDFPAEKYINRFPAKKHDHFLIPAGTIHCSGSNSMVLEISATPYIFTFKLWDWSRLGLDGKPRPVHIDHGEKVIQWDRATSWVEENLLPRAIPVDSGEGWRCEHTGLHQREFIETRRYWFTGPVPLDTRGNVHMLNLVQGEEAVVQSPQGAFPPFVVHYAETFIIPAAVGPYTLIPSGPGKGQEMGVIQAYVRN
ncbi:MAG: class I mannose-6-phosphate isomerase [Candidatus Limiplasma sp.]|nr:class I mannose-6-phosphate isomerase [Candidatus Limiplasma sp.]